MDEWIGRVLKLVLFAILVLSLSPALATTCPNCRAENPDDVNRKFCQKCGASLVRDARIPSVLGRSKDEAVQLLRSDGFRVSVESTQSEEAPGKVLKQSQVGAVTVRIGSKLSVTIWVSVPLPEPGWLTKLRDASGWPDPGKSVAGIGVGDSENSVLNTLGEPTLREGNSWRYQHGEDELRVVLADGQVDTIAVSMSASLFVSENIALNKYIIPSLAGKEPEETDSLQKAYPDKGITFSLRSDTVVGFSIYAPRKEAPWVSALKRNWTSLAALSPASLGGLAPDNIKVLFGDPQRADSGSMVYEDTSNRLVFSLVGGEIDTVSLLLAKALLESLPVFKTSQESREAYGQPTSYGSAGGREELVYSDSGIAMIFDSGVLTSMRRFYPEYHNMVLIPAGDFLLGTSRPDIKEMRTHHPEWGRLDFGNEMPQQKVFLTSFYVDKYEVTNRQFQQFVKATDHKVTGDWRPRRGKENHPATGVTWNDAQAYAKWAGKRLPTEIEWEKAARCSLGYWYPWGYQSLGSAVPANYEGDSATGATFPVDSLEEGKSLYGVYNMAGNVMEWCANPYDAGYYKSMPKANPNGTEKTKSDSLVSVRGGSFQSSLFQIRAPRRYSLKKNGSWRYDLGFRCVKDAKVKKEE